MALLFGRFTALFVVAAMQFVPLPSTAAPSTGAEQSGQQPDDQDAERLIADYFRQIQSKDFNGALATTDKLKHDSDNKTGRGIVAALRGSANLGLNRDEKAARLFAEARAVAPDEPFVDYVAFVGGLTADKKEVAAVALDRMIARAPDAVRELDLRLMWHFLRNEPKEQEARNDDRRVALARLGYGGSEGDYLVGEAVGILLKRRDVAGAGELLKFIDEPRDVEDLLIQKRFSALWSQLEALAGPRLENVRASSVAVAERAYAEEPTNYEKLQLFANALRYAGRYDEAIALRSKLPSSSQAMSSADEQLGWAVNNVALALHEAGRADEADQLFALLNDAPIENETWRVSMKINRLELLVRDGKFDRSLPLVEPTARAKGSPYAEQLVRRLRLCVMSGLGRKEEAARLLPDVLKHAEDAPGPTIDGLLCAHEFEKAEQVAIAALRKETFEGDFVRQLQSRALTSDDPSVWQERWAELRKRPAIAREFDRLGRDMPEALLPPSSK